MWYYEHLQEEDESQKKEYAAVKEALEHFEQLELSGEAGPAVSYALGQGAPLIAAIWGVFIWKEFKGSTKSVNQLLALMFIFFLVGLGMIVVAGN